MAYIVSGGDFESGIIPNNNTIPVPTNQMIQLGDWIELPSENVDGIIVDIALHTVKVKNWDMTIELHTTEPEKVSI